MSRLLLIGLVVGVRWGSSFLWGEAWAVERNPAGYVVEVSGKKEQVKILREKQVLPATEKLSLYVHDITKTGDKSTSQLLLKAPESKKGERESTIFVFENSEFRVNPEIITAGNKKSTIIELPRGLLSATVKNLKKDEDVRIKTPNAIIGIRGSFLTVSVYPDPVTHELQTSIIQASGDISVLPPHMVTSSLDSPAAAAVTSGSTVTIKTTEQAAASSSSATSEESSTSESTTQTTSTETTTTTTTTTTESTPTPSSTETTTESAPTTTTETTTEAPSTSTRAPTSSGIVLVEVAPAPVNVPVMLDANPTPTFDPSMALSIDQISGGQTATTQSETAQVITTSSESVTAILQECVFGIGSLSSQTLAEAGRCN